MKTVCTIVPMKSQKRDTDYSTAKQCFPFKLIALVIASVLRLKCIRHKWFQYLFQFNSYYRTFDRVNCIRMKICTRKQLQTSYVFFFFSCCLFYRFEKYHTDWSDTIISLLNALNHFFGENNVLTNSEFSVRSKLCQVETAKYKYTDDIRLPSFTHCSNYYIVHSPNDTLSRH